ncbi:response regulator [Aquabacterium humicola]|uniref:response regulator n=1 Tax=Aquabacterium humicola TaxID=3237377 RepID=UPI002543B611|nr:response regulator [Rubrivivax pictus]
MPIAERTLRVLVVDDVRDFADSLAELLAHMGCEPRVAYDAVGALRVAMEQRPQVIFVDLFLGQQSGSHLMQSLRRLLGDDDPPTIVCLTGHDSAENELRCRQAGFDLYLVKPVSMAMVRDILTTCRGIDATSERVPRSGGAGRPAR